MAKLVEQTGPMIRSTTCLQRYRATPLGCEEIQQLSPRDPLAEYRSTPLIHSVSMKNILGDIQTDYDNLQHGPLPKLNISTLAHQCRRGRLKAAAVGPKGKAEDRHVAVRLEMVGARRRESE
jgi:hypothetical protein